MLKRLRLSDLWAEIGIGEIFEIYDYFSSPVTKNSLIKCQICETDKAATCISRRTVPRRLLDFSMRDYLLTCDSEECKTIAQFKLL